MEEKKDIAVFGGGCFWCTEAIFKMLKGVSGVEPGYTGGTTENPTYEEVCSKNTGHAEAIRISYNPEEISYHDLLTVFFGSHDATQVNRQGNDVGVQYRSAIFYASEAQKEEAETFIKELTNSAQDGDPIATEVVPLTVFYPAERNHQDYFSKNQNQGYCQVVIAPKLQKVQKEFAQLLKAHS